MILARLRSGNSKDYKVPRGFAFDYITCPNYTFEIWGWILFGIATQTLAAFAFIVCGGAQMAQWALQKHARLRRVRLSGAAVWLAAAHAASVTPVTMLQARRDETAYCATAVQPSCSPSLANASTLIPAAFRWEGGPGQVPQAMGLASSTSLACPTALLDP